MSQELLELDKPDLKDRASVLKKLQGCKTPVSGIILRCEIQTQEEADHFLFALESSGAESCELGTSLRTPLTIGEEVLAYLIRGIARHKSLKTFWISTAFRFRLAEEGALSQSMLQLAKLPNLCHLQIYNIVFDFNILQTFYRTSSPQKFKTISLSIAGPPSAEHLLEILQFHAQGKQLESFVINSDKLPFIPVDISIRRKVLVKILELIENNPRLDLLSLFENGIVESDQEFIDWEGINKIKKLLLSREKFVECFYPQLCNIDKRFELFMDKLRIISILLRACPQIEILLKDRFSFQNPFLKSTLSKNDVGRGIDIYAMAIKDNDKIFINSKRSKKSEPAKIIICDSFYEDSISTRGARFSAYTFYFLLARMGFSLFGWQGNPKNLLPIDISLDQLESLQPSIYPTRSSVVKKLLDKEGIRDVICLDLEDVSRATREIETLMQKNGHQWLTFQVSLKIGISTSKYHQQVSQLGHGIAPFISPYLYRVKWDARSVAVRPLLEQVKRNQYWQEIVIYVDTFETLLDALQSLGEYVSNSVRAIIQVNDPIVLSSQQVTQLCSFARQHNNARRAIKIKADLNKILLANDEAFQNLVKKLTEINTYSNQFVEFDIGTPPAKAYTRELFFPSVKRPSEIHERDMKNHPSHVSVEEVLYSPTIPPEAMAIMCRKEVRNTLVCNSGTLTEESLVAFETDFGPTVPVTSVTLKPLSYFTKERCKEKNKLYSPDSADCLTVYLGRSDKTPVRLTNTSWFALPDMENTELFEFGISENVPLKFEFSPYTAQFLVQLDPQRTPPGSWVTVHMAYFMRERKEPFSLRRLNRERKEPFFLANLNSFSGNFLSPSVRHALLTFCKNVLGSADPLFKPLKKLLQQLHRILRNSENSTTDIQQKCFDLIDAYCRKFEPVIPAPLKLHKNKLMDEWFTSLVRQQGVCDYRHAGFFLLAHACGLYVAKPVNDLHTFVQVLRPRSVGSSAQPILELTRKDLGGGPGPEVRMELMTNPVAVAEAAPSISVPTQETWVEKRMQEFKPHVHPLAGVTTEAEYFSGVLATERPLIRTDDASAALGFACQLAAYAKKQGYPVIFMRREQELADLCRLPAVHEGSPVTKEGLLKQLHTSGRPTLVIIDWSDMENWYPDLCNDTPRLGNDSIDASATPFLIVSLLNKSIPLCGGDFTTCKEVPVPSQLRSKLFVKPELKQITDSKGLPASVAVIDFQSNSDPDSIQRSMGNRLSVSNGQLNVQPSPLLTSSDTSVLRIKNPPEENDAWQDALLILFYIHGYVCHNGKVVKIAALPPALFVEKAVIASWPNGVIHLPDPSAPITPTTVVRFLNEQTLATFLPGVRVDDKNKTFESGEAPGICDLARKMAKGSTLRLVITGGLTLTASERIALYAACDRCLQAGIGLEVYEYSAAPGVSPGSGTADDYSAQPVQESKAEPPTSALFFCKGGDLGGQVARLQAQGKISKGADTTVFLVSASNTSSDFLFRLSRVPSQEAKSASAVKPLAIAYEEEALLTHMKAAKEVRCEGSMDVSLLGQFEPLLKGYYFGNYEYHNITGRLTLVLDDDPELRAAAVAHTPVTLGALQLADYQELLKAEKIPDYFWRGMAKIAEVADGLRLPFRWSLFRLQAVAEDFRNRVYPERFETLLLADYDQSLESYGILREVVDWFFAPSAPAEGKREVKEDRSAAVDLEQPASALIEAARASYRKKREAKPHSAKHVSPLTTPQRRCSLEAAEQQHHEDRLKKVLKILERDRRVSIQGLQGVGKTHARSQIVEHYEKLGRRVVLHITEDRRKIDEVIKIATRDSDPNDPLHIVWGDEWNMRKLHTYDGSLKKPLPANMRVVTTRNPEQSFPGRHPLPDNLQSVWFDQLSMECIFSHKVKPFFESAFRIKHPRQQAELWSVCDAARAWLEKNELESVFSVRSLQRILGFAWALSATQPESVTALLACMGKACHQTLLPAIPVAQQADFLKTLQQAAKLSPNSSWPEVQVPPQKPDAKDGWVDTAFQKNIQALLHVTFLLLAQEFDLPKYPLLIEAPALSGKTSAVERWLRAQGRPYVVVIFNPEDENSFKRALREASLKGGVVIVKGLNMLLPELECWLNQFLDGVDSEQPDAQRHPLFQLIVLQHPPTARNCCALSKALADRMLRCEVEEESVDDLVSVVEREKAPRPFFLAHLFHGLASYCQEYSHKPLNIQQFFQWIKICKENSALASAPNFLVRAFHELLKTSGLLLTEDQQREAYRQCLQNINQAMLLNVAQFLLFPGSGLSMQQQREFSQELAEHFKGMAPLFLPHDVQQEPFLSEDGGWVVRAEISQRQKELMGKLPDSFVASLEEFISRKIDMHKEGSSGWKYQLLRATLAEIRVRHTLRDMDFTTDAFKQSFFCTGPAAKRKRDEKQLSEPELGKRRKTAQLSTDLSGLGVVEWGESVESEPGWVAASLGFSDMDSEFEFLCSKTSN